MMSEDKDFDEMTEGFYVGNYMKEFMRHHLKMKTFLPYELCAERFFTITLEGLGELVFVYDNSPMNEGLQLLANQLKTLRKIYGKKYIFSEPQLIIRPANERRHPPVIMEMKVGMMEKEHYKQYLKRKKTK